MADYRVEGQGGTGLRVFEQGAADGPEILFVHGFCHCRLAWEPQLGSPLLAGCRLVSSRDAGRL